MAQRTSRPRPARSSGADKTVNTVASKPAGLFFVALGAKWFSDGDGEYRCDPETGWAVEKL